jgi:hypothetical protein
MKRFSQLSMLLLAVSFTACTTVSQEDLDLITGLENRVSAVESKVMSINLEEVSSTAQTVASNMDFMKENYRDVSNREFVIATLSDYRAIRKPMSKYSSKQSAFIKEVAYTKNQLKNLRSDLQKKDIDKDAFITYVETEAKAVSVLESKATAACNQVLALQERFNELNPIVLEAIETIK